MKCGYCGHEIPEGKLYCEKCGREVCIVPDYNPLEDMLTQQIRGAITGGDGYEDYLEYDAGRERDPGRRSTVRDVRSGTGRNTGGVSRSTSRDVRGGTGRNTGGVSRSTSRDVRGGTGRNTGGLNRSTSRDVRGNAGRNYTENLQERERKRRQAERRKARRRMRLGCLFMIFILLAAIIGSGITLYMNSYKGFVDRGNKSLRAGAYNEAIDFFERAIQKDETKADAYIGLSQIYIAKNDLGWAESIFQEAIKKQPENADIYEAYVKFYMDTDQKAKIPHLLEDVDDKVAELLAGYIIEKPKFSLDDSETFEDVQELTLTAQDGCKIYYTDDGEEATIRSKEYTEPLQIEEGENVISAIAVDEKGVPSLLAKKTYIVELPIVDAPAVSPSTGQYNSPVQIEVKVPDGYEAYYTTTGEEPTTASNKYTEPIDMPEGETLFKVILVNAKGRMSGVTTRNYVLETE
ncbi:MAG: tetratricopeptide repeat protein [Dorea sp.]|nr:tetratricopeptide repeat protein [Dorea sp.]